LAGWLTIQTMAVERLEHLGIVVDDLAPAIEFFSAIGLEMEGEGSVGGELVDRIIALEGTRADMAIMQTPNGQGKVELVKFQSPAYEGESAVEPSNALGIRHVLFKVDDIDGAVAAVTDLGYELMGELVNYENIYRLCYVRGPAGIIVELAEQIS
jgi:catechol 2,3-dioxygenase-like lactoylglutathione lyase family enzyme